MPVWAIILGVIAVFAAGLFYAAYRITKGGQEAGRVEGDK